MKGLAKYKSIGDDLRIAVSVRIEEYSKREVYEMMRMEGFRN